MHKYHELPESHTVSDCKNVSLQSLKSYKDEWQNYQDRPKSIDLYLIRPTAVVTLLRTVNFYYLYWHFHFLLRELASRVLITEVKTQLKEILSSLKVEMKECKDFFLC